MRRIAVEAMARKCATVLHLRATLVHQPEVRLVDEGRGIEAVARGFPAQLPVGQLAELLVHERVHLIAGGGIPRAGALQEFGHTLGGIHAGWPDLRRFGASIGRGSQKLAGVTVRFRNSPKVHNEAVRRNRLHGGKAHPRRPGRESARSPPIEGRPRCEPHELLLPSCSSSGRLAAPSLRRGTNQGR